MPTMWCSASTEKGEKEQGSSWGRRDTAARVGFAAWPIPGPWMPVGRLLRDIIFGLTPLIASLLVLAQEPEVTSHRSQQGGKNPQLHKTLWKTPSASQLPLLGLPQSPSASLTAFWGCQAQPCLLITDLINARMLGMRLCYSLGSCIQGKLPVLSSPAQAGL